MDYKKYICPVCRNNFKEDDDVVVCPDCGTPHHRACWFENGKCFNHASHGKEEIVFEKTEDKTDEKAEKITAEFSHVEGSVNEKAEDSDFVFKPNDPELAVNPSSTILINGREAFYYQISVRKNMKYYIPTFSLISDSKSKVFSWNVAAFFVPLAWSFYRKMYKLAAIMLAVYTVVFGIMAYYNFTDKSFSEISEQCYQEDPAYAEKVMLSLMGRDVVLTENQQKYIEEMQKERVPQPLAISINMVLIASKILIALNANKLYLKKITQTIKKGEDKGLRGELLKFYVYKKGGTLPLILAVIIGITEMTLF